MTENNDKLMAAEQKAEEERAHAEKLSMNLAKKIGTILQSKVPDLAGAAVTKYSERTAELSDDQLGKLKAGVDAFASDLPSRAHKIFQDTFPLVYERAADVSKAGASGSSMTYRDSISYGCGELFKGLDVLIKTYYPAWRGGNRPWEKRWTSEFESFIGELSPELAQFEDGLKAFQEAAVERQTAAKAVAEETAASRWSAL